MPNFEEINVFGRSKNESFERLVCLLAKRERIQGASNFQSNDGSGGDGGVDAIWLLSDGGEIGYQAKFFSSLGERQWKQMDNSVKRALDVHPNLRKYIIALPLDLTQNRGKNSEQSQREKWDARVKKWKVWAREKSIDIEFELWDAIELEDKLVRKENITLMKHYFGRDVLDDIWFAHCLETNIHGLQYRFSPSEHVKVSIESLFATMVRDTSIVEKLKGTFAKLEESKVPSIEFITAELTPDADTLSAANEAWKKLIDIKHLFSRDFSISWNIDLIKSTLNRLREAVWALENRYRLHLFNKKEFSKEEQNKLEIIMRKLHILSSSCHELAEFFEEHGGQIFYAEVERCALVYGPAGAGKSHIFAQVANQRIQKGLPTILILGQNFLNEDFWEQIGIMLGLKERTAEYILGILNAAGERKGERTILFFDAINEGIGFQYWKQNLHKVVNEIKKYTHLAVAFSCREEYVPYTIPEPLLKKLPQFRIDGFLTPEEREHAAIKYLDTKGISRTNTPWLSSEFRNPLFLKVVSEALHAKGAKEFPRGLHGISQIVSLYLEALSERMSINFTDHDVVTNSIKECVQLVAENMALEGRDSIKLKDAANLAEKCFKGRTAPEGKTWLQVLIEVNLFRRDAPPYQDGVDALNSPTELVRFTFQKFQDHLVAKSLVARVEQDKVTKSFNKGGPFNFLFDDGKTDQGLLYEYRGLIDALSTIFPEEFGVEFAKILPNWKWHWEQNELSQAGFAESFKWRSTDAFSEDTRELFNLLSDYYVDRLGLLMEVSMAIDHPFNAHRLHSLLKQKSMPERDSYWTRWINNDSQEEFNQVNRIVSWALSLRSQGADIDVEHLKLSSIVLVWFLSSSRITLRDHATKALTTLFLIDSNIFVFILEKMHDCNDPYIIERLYASAFGACCKDPTPDRLIKYSQVVFLMVFANKQPPVAILTRDYALGIIELADSKNVLNNNVRLEDCYHPFNSDAPVFDLTEEEVKNIAKAQGGEEIFQSTAGVLGDYGRYTIPGRVDNFLTTPLSQPKPFSMKQLTNTFVREVIFPYPERVAALKRYEEIKNSPDAKVYPNIFDIEADQEKARIKMARHQKKLKDAIRCLKNLLNEKEIKRWSAEYFDDREGYRHLEKIDEEQCRLWIAKRAYELGWNSQLFPGDGDRTNYSRYENDLERIGKKYQRIALDEIQARLADNYWFFQDWPEELSIYRHSHYNFRRDIEPTILPMDLRHARLENQPESWIVKPIIEILEATEIDPEQWPFEKDATVSIIDKLFRVDEEGKRWLLLYEYNTNKFKYRESNPNKRNILRCEEFSFIFCVFLKRGKAEEIVKFLKAESNLDIFLFRPEKFIDGPYFREAPWRDTWKSVKFSKHLTRAPDGCEFAIPIAEYHWENSLDKTLPNGVLSYMPQKWFVDDLNLLMSQQEPRAWINKDGEVLIQSYGPFEHPPRLSEQQTGVVINEEVLFDYAKNFEIEPVWLMIAERNSYPTRIGYYRRRSEGVVWHTSKSWKKDSWNRNITG